jgi:hypothetical protein
VHAARVGMAVVAVVLVSTACVNLSPPPGAHRSDGGFVVHRGVGEACQAATDCQSGFCSDGICCKDMCKGTCMTCALAGSKGSCVPAEEGSDPRGECNDDGPTSCKQNGTCDGAGACAHYPASSVCQEAQCELSTLTPASRCNDKGECVPSTPQDCFPFGCSNGARKCLSTCTDDRQCSGGKTCENGTCGALPIGSPCADGAQCAKGICADGVCCQTDCPGSCRSCNVAGSEGTCTNIPAGFRPDPMHPLCGTGTPDVTTCMLDGTCDGAGACRLFPAGKACAPASCSTATLRELSSCDGKGHCVAPAPTTCGGYTCASATACRTTCAADADCAAPSVCSLKGAACGGLTAQYFHQTNLTELAFTRTDAAIDFNWMLGSPSAALNNDNFSVRWHGKITARFSEPYTFYVGSDDGERLWVGTTLLIDRYTRHASVPEDVAMTVVKLSAGVPVDITMEYFENGGDANVRLLWQSPSEPKAVVPTSALSPQ